MRVTALILLAFCLLAGSADRADAEKVKTNQTTKVYARPGEQAKILVTVKSGQNMTLLAKDGRWLKVRVNGRTGYVPRSKVDMADDDEISRNTRRRPFVDGRSRRRGFGGDAPDDRIGADATGDGADSGDDEEEEEEEEEEDEKPAKKTPAKAPTKVAAKATDKKTPAKKGGDEDEEDEEEEDEEEPAPKKATTKATTKKGGDEDDEDEEEEDDAPPKKGGGDDEEEEEEEEAPEPARLVARVGKKVAVYEKPNADSSEAFVVRPSDILYPSDEKNGWTFVENSEGDSGWIESSELEIEGSGGPGGGGKKQLDIRARMGLMFIQQGVRTQGSTNLDVPDNYNIGTSSVALAVGAGIVIPRGKKLLLGGEFSYDYAKTLLGGIFYDADGKGGNAGVNIGVTIHNINVRGLVGIDLKKKSGMALFGRLGYRYQGFLITDVASMTANPAKLPSEVVKAPTVGAALSIPKLTDKIGMRFALDAIVFGSSIKQTVGLEDGSAPTAKAVVVGTGFTYQWKKAMNLQATYDLQYMGIDFGPPLMSSTRGHMGTRTSRTDFFHVVTVGISKPF
jgi:uncharacterized protein YgiM (DUF1202 family)